MKKKWLLIISFALIFLLPRIGAYLKFGGLPPGYGFFPARQVEQDPGFNLWVFIGFSVVELFVYCFLLFPKWFGFKTQAGVPGEKKAVGYPPWFKPAVIVTLISWLLMWGRFKLVYPLEHFTFVPLWWGFIFVLDGIVYKRNNGVSLISSKPSTMTLLAITSSGSWFVFEYLNFFVMENWYYPNYTIFTNFGNIAWQLLSYTTVLPAIFEWYLLLKTFKVFKDRYTNGPKITISTTWLYILLVVGLGSFVLMGYFPYPLFFMLWISLIPGLVPAMTVSKMWTPFTPISTRGDWSYLAMIGIATLLNGFFWEFWNFGSSWFHPTEPTNPNYWKYSVPYVDVIHIFSQMPLLGYCGYVLFGVVCWVLWVAMANIFGFNPSITLNDNDDETNG